MNLKKVQTMTKEELIHELIHVLTKHFPPKKTIVCEIPTSHYERVMKLLKEKNETSK